jgi:hypothetical protein
MTRKRVHVTGLIPALFVASVVTLTQSSCVGPEDSTDLSQAQLYAATTAAICGTVNEGGSMALACPSGQTISAAGFASYGTPSGSCGAFAKGTCDASTSMSVVSNACVGKSSCSVSASYSTFGDPCFGTAKRLYAQVTCSSAICGTVNENASMALACPSGQTISAVGFASYGTPSGSCGAFAKGSCDAPTSMSVASNACIGKSSCSVSASYSTFGDPCFGTAKRFYAQVTCSALGTGGTVGTGGAASGSGTGGKAGSGTGGAPGTGGAAASGTGGAPGTGGAAASGTGGAPGTGGAAASGTGGSSAAKTTGTGGSGPITAILVASRTSGYAPLAVHFDATGSTSTTAGISDLAQGGTFRQIKHAFDFGDPNSGTHSISGLSKNSEPSGGGLAAHVFDTAGTYVVKVTSADGSGSTATASVTITVNDPSVLTTYAISKTGSFTGAPAGSTHLTQSTLPTFASNCRYFFNRGEDWSILAIDIEDPLTNITVDAYGTGANPTFASVSVGNSRPNSASFPTDIRICNVTAVSNGFTYQNGAQFLFYKCNGAPGSNIGASWTHDDQYSNISQSAYTNSHEVFFVDCVLLGPTNPTSYTIYGNGSRLVFLNTYTGGVNEGNMRFTAWERGVMRHCRVEVPYTDSSYHAVKLHSGGPNAYDDNWLVSGGRAVTSSYINWMTSKVVFANNYFGGGNNGAAIANWTVAICPQNDSTGLAGSEPLGDIILENNKFIHSQSWGGSNMDIAWGGRRLTSRNNSVVQGSGSFVVGKGHAQVAAYDGPYFTN